MELKRVDKNLMDESKYSVSRLYSHSQFGGNAAFKARTGVCGKSDKFHVVY